MNFALIGDQPEVLPLLQAIARHPDHHLKLALCPEMLQSAVRSFSPSTQFVQQWETLLVDDSVEAVIFSGAEPGQITLVKQVVNAGKHLLLFPSYAQSTELYYELSLTQDQAPITLFPVLPLLYDPAVSRLRSQLTKKVLGELHYLQMERDHRETFGTGPTVFQVDEALLNDVLLLRYLGGNYTEVTAQRTETADGHVPRSSATLGGEDLPTANWTWTTGEANQRWRVMVAGETGKAVLQSSGDPYFPELISQNPELSLPAKTASRIDIAERILSDFLKVHEQQSSAARWQELVSVMETVDATHRSIRKRRTIDLHFEVQSERSQFKSQMATLGCGVLVFTLLGIVALLLIGAIFGAPPQLMLILRGLVFLPIFLFLLIQGLIFFTRPAAKPVPIPEQSENETPVA